MSARLSHIGVPVPDLEEACLFYARLVGADEVRLSAVPEIGVRNAFVAVGDRVHFEIIETADGGPIRVLDDVMTHGQQMMCLECDDVDATVAQLRADGFGDHIIDLPQNPAIASLPFPRAWVKRSAHGDFSIELVPTGAVQALWEKAEVIKVEDLRRRPTEHLSARGESWLPTR